MPRDPAAIGVLLSILDRAYDRRSWHGPNLRGSLRGLTPREAGWRPAPGRHNIWEIAVHAAYWKYVVLRALTGGRRGAFGRKGSDWFVLPSDSSDEAWKADLALLDATHRALREAIRKVEPGTLDRPLPGKKTTRGELISGIAAHDVYHAGQIQLIKRIDGTGRNR
jgi:hypothetical protein